MDTDAITDLVLQTNLSINQVLDLLVKLDQLDERLAEDLQGVSNALYTDTLLSYIAVGMLVFVTTLVTSPHAAGVREVIRTRVRR